MAVFCMYVFGGGWAPIVVGAISDALSALGLKTALSSWRSPVSSRPFSSWLDALSGDMDRVKNAVLEAEK